MLAKFCQALSHPVRLQLLKILATRMDCFCGDVIEVGSFSEKTVLHHLRILHQAGFIQGEVDGPQRCYRLNPDTLQRFKCMIAQL